jgi:hypothetical protein
MVAKNGLEKYLLQVRKELNEFSKLFGQVYFSYA